MRRARKQHGDEKMTQQQANEIAMAIIQNENKSISELTDSQICIYLVDRNVEETKENIAAIRKA
jgi:hypothetical protein